MNGPRRWLLPAGAALACLALAAGIDRTDLWPPDEPRVAEVSREMLADGSWLLPQLNGTPFLEEPPLFYWLQALTYRVAGEASATAARLPAVAGAIAGVVATALVARALGASGAIAAIVLATAPEYWWMARAATPDTTNAALTTIALGLFLLAWRSGRPGHLAGAVAAAGVAFWLKSFLGVGLVVLTAVGFMLAAGRGRLAWRGLAFAAVGLGAIALGWLAVLGSREGNEGLSFFLVTNHLERVVARGPIGHVRSPIYYLPNLALGLLPWSAVVPAALLAAWRERRDPARLFPFVWAAVMVLALSCASTKRPHYPLPAYAGFALLVAQWWPGAIERGLGRLTGGALTGTLLIGCPVIVLVSLALRPEALFDPPSGRADWLASVLPTAIGWQGVIAVAGVIAAAAVFVRGRRARRAPVALLGAAACVVLVHLVIVLEVLPRMDPFCSARALGQRLAGVVARGVPVVTFGFQNREKLSPLLFYSRSRLPSVEEADGLAAMLRKGPACAVVDPADYARVRDAIEESRGVPTRAGRLPVVLVSGRGGGCPEPDARDGAAASSAP